MADSLLALRRKIDSARELAGVVRTMKALAASSISQYEEAVTSLADYRRTVELGLSTVLKPLLEQPRRGARQPGKAVVIVFGSDQGLVGQFNEDLARTLQRQHTRLAQDYRLIAIGERMASQLEQVNLVPARHFHVPTSVEAITGLCAQLLLSECAVADQAQELELSLSLFFNRIHQGQHYRPEYQIVLPLDQVWQQRLHDQPWPTRALPEACGDWQLLLSALLHEYLFVSTFRACAESLAAENLCRLSAMQRAEKNIGEQLELLQQRYHRQRQDSIDAELFDVTSGFEQLEQAEQAQHRQSGQTPPQPACHSGQP